MVNQKQYGQFYRCVSDKSIFPSKYQCLTILTIQRDGIVYAHSKRIFCPTVHSWLSFKFKKRINQFVRKKIGKFRKTTNEHEQTTNVQMKSQASVSIVHCLIHPSAICCNCSLQYKIFMLATGRSSLIATRFLNPLWPLSSMFRSLKLNVSTRIKFKLSQFFLWMGCVRNNQ